MKEQETWWHDPSVCLLQLVEGNPAQFAPYPVAHRVECPKSKSSNEIRDMSLANTHPNMPSYLKLPTNVGMEMEAIKKTNVFFFGPSL